jgi:hypothetical protein
MSILKEEEDKVMFYKTRMHYQYKKFHTMDVASRRLLARTLVGMYVLPRATLRLPSEWYEVTGITEAKATLVSLPNDVVEKYILHCRSLPKRKEIQTSVACSFIDRQSVDVLPVVHEIAESGFRVHGKPLGVLEELEIELEISDIKRVSETIPSMV